MDETGRLCTSEVVFQMRLLWGEWIRTGIIPQIQTPEHPKGAGLSNEAVRMLRLLYIRYTQQRGRARFQRNVLMRLRQMEIGLEWFRHELVNLGKDFAGSDLFLEPQWERFLRDEEGRLRAGERLFQMHLMLANLYRERSELGNTTIACKSTLA